MGVQMVGGGGEPSTGPPSPPVRPVPRSTPPHRVAQFVESCDLVRAGFVESCNSVRAGFIESWIAVVKPGVSMTQIHDSAVELRPRTRRIG